MHRGPVNDATSRGRWSFSLVFRLFLWSFVWSFVIFFGLLFGLSSFSLVFCLVFRHHRAVFFIGLLVFCHNRAVVFGVRCFVKSPVWIGDVQNLDQCSPKRQVKKTKPPALKLFHFAGFDVSQPVWSFALQCWSLFGLLP